jgi:ubiquinone/menaquinone biosynthesis C-methylase UbiE
MDVTDQTGNQQTKLWNGAAGRSWVETQDLLNQIFRPFEDLLVNAVRARSGNRVLDVGCGTGSTTLAVARLLGATGSCAGIDVSEPMIAAARLRSERERTAARFIRADAEIHAFESASFDMIISRFGVMFFDDSVRAFANLRRAATDNAFIQFIAWRSAEENAFMTTAEQAAAHLLPNLAPRRPDAPGQFAFADPRRVQTVLEESGWTEIDIRPVDVVCTLREEDLNDYLTRLGPVGLALQDVDEWTRTQVIKTVRPAFDAYVQGSEVRFTAACWMVSAEVSSAVVTPK